MGKKPKIIAKNAALHIDSLGQKGDGIADFKGEAAFIDGVLAGEDITCDLSRGHDGQLRGKVTAPAQIIKAAPQRVEPPCKYAWRCGGCSLQHMEYSFYRDWTRQRVEALFARADIKPAHWREAVFIPSHTRRRASFAALKQHEDLRLGFREKRSHTILDIENCMVLQPELFKIVQDMRPFLMRILRDSRACNLFVQMTDSGADVVFSGEIGAKGEPDLPVHEAVAEMINALPIARISWRRREREALTLLLEARPLLHNFGALSVHLPSMAFMQPSKEGEAALITAMQAGLPPLKDGDDKTMRIADLFAGCGTLTGALMPYGRVHGFEGEAAAVQALKGGMQRRGDHHKAMRRDLFKDPLSAEECGLYDIIVMDPPRAGAKAQAQNLACLSGEKPHTLIYISCNPASFARDAAILTEGNWRFESVQVIDQFIWSAHTELCGIFKRG